MAKKNDNDSKKERQSDEKWTRNYEGCKLLVIMLSQAKDLSNLFTLRIQDSVLLRPDL